VLGIGEVLGVILQVLALWLLIMSTEVWRKHGVAHGVDNEAVRHASCSAQVPKA